MCYSQRWLQRTLCIAFFMALFAGLFQQSVYDSGNDNVIEAYWLLMKSFACVALSCVASVLKTLFAKLMSNHFYKDSYCDKMQDALCKVRQQSSPALSFDQQCFKGVYRDILAECQLGIAKEYYLVALAQQRSSDDSPIVAKSAVSVVMSRLVIKPT